MDGSSNEESSRQELLRMLAVLDTAPEPAFDALIRSASRVCRCPISLMSLIDVDRQWFKAAVGLEATETPRDQAFCAHAVEGETLFEIPDAAADSRFADNPLVTDGPRIRFYAGQPIVYEGVAIGTLCVIDQVPRALDEEQRATLADLALAAAALLTGRMQANLHRREARRLRDFAELSGDWLWESDLQHRCTWLSGDASKASGLFRGTIIGERFGDSMVHDWVGRPIPGPGLLALMESSLPFSNVVVSTTTPQGQRFISLSATPMVGDGEIGAGINAGYRGSARDVTDRVNAEMRLRAVHDALQANERRLRDITDSIPAVIGHFDMNEKCLFANAVGLAAHGLTLDDLPALTFGSHIDRALYEQHVPAIRKVLAGKRSIVHGHRQIDGRQNWFKAHLVPDLDEHGVQRGFYVVTFDITTLKFAEIAKANSEQRLRDITNNLPVLISHIDADERFTYVNDTFKAWVGKEDSDLIGLTVAEALGPELYAQRGDLLCRCLHGERIAFNIESVYRGESRFLQTTYLPDALPDGRVVGMTSLSVDVSDLKKAEHRLMRLAHHDVLTTLPNRLRFNDELDEALAEERRPGRSMAVMFLDIDRFKTINDTHGHAVGDAVLQAFANRVRRSVRTTDFVARLSGDEFVVILRDLSHVDEARNIARKVVEHVGRPFIAKGILLNVTTSVGVAIKDGANVDRAHILGKADAALYEAKEAGRNTFRLAA